MFNRQMIILLTFLYPQSLLFAILCISKRHLKVPAKTDRKQKKESIHGLTICAQYKLTRMKSVFFWFMVTLCAQHMLTRMKSGLSGLWLPYMHSTYWPGRNLIFSVLKQTGFLFSYSFMFEYLHFIYFKLFLPVVSQIRKLEAACSVVQERKLIKCAQSPESAL